MPQVVSIRRALHPLALILFFCAVALADLSAETLTFWVGNLQNELPLIRKQAANKLGEIQDSRALAPLQDALATEVVADVRLAIIESLVRLGDMRSINALVSASKKDKDYYVRFYAKRAVTRITEYNERLEEKRRLEEAKREEAEKRRLETPELEPEE